MQFFRRDSKENDDMDPAYQGQSSVRDRALAAIQAEDQERAEQRERDEAARQPELEEPVAQTVPPLKPSEPPQPPRIEGARPLEPGKWNPQGERKPMNPVPRERLPYPDLPMQNPERPIVPERPMNPERGPERGPVRPYQASAPVARTVIDKDSHFNGNFRSDSDLLIEGNFEGEIDCKGTVIVAEGANISATVRSRNAVVAGSANGDITCDERLTIQATGELRGKAQAATLIVEEGAFFEGEFKMGSGGFTAMGGGFSNWQNQRPQQKGGSSPSSGGPSGSERRDENREPFVRNEPGRNEPPRPENPRPESDQPKKDAWS